MVARRGQVAPLVGWLMYNVPLPMRLVGLAVWCLLLGFWRVACAVSRWSKTLSNTLPHAEK